MLIPQAEIERALIVSNEKIFDQHGVRRSGEIAPPSCSTRSADAFPHPLLILTLSKAYIDHGCIFRYP